MSSKKENEAVFEEAKAVPEPKSSNDNKITLREFVFTNGKIKTFAREAVLGVLSKKVGRRGTRSAYQTAYESWLNSPSEKKKEGK